MISVVMPVYNTEKTLKRAVQSVLDQTYTDFELLLIDDGSTDASPELCDRLASSDSRIRVIHKTNEGPSAARNQGKRLAKGEYLAYIDSDDYYEPDIFQTFIEEKLDKTDLYIFNFRRLRANGIQEMSSINAEDLNAEEALIAIFRYGGTDFYSWNKIYRTSIFQEVDYPVGHLYEEIQTIYQYVSRCQSVMITDKVGYNYIENPDSIVNQSFNPRQYDNVVQRQELLQSVREDFPNVVPYAEHKLLDGYLSTGYKLYQTKNSDEKTTYLKRLRRESKRDLPDFKQDREIPKLKIWALYLLEISLPLYGRLYKWYLGK